MGVNAPNQSGGLPHEADAHVRHDYITIPNGALHIIES